MARVPILSPADGPVTDPADILDVRVRSGSVSIELGSREMLHGLKVPILERVHANLAAGLGPDGQRLPPVRGGRQRGVRTGKLLASLAVVDTETGIAIVATGERASDGSVGRVFRPDGYRMQNPLDQADVREAVQREVVQRIVTR